QLEGAAQDLAAAKQLTPTDARVLVTAAELAFQRGRIDEARAAWSEGLNTHPDTLNMHLGLATLEIAEKRPQQAIACLRRSLERFPGNADLLHLLVAIYLEQGDIK